MTKRKTTEEQRIRIRICNLVKRRISSDMKKCCICGGKGVILHNMKNPFNISFICYKCRQNPENIKIAESKRFDLRKYYTTKRDLAPQLFSDEDTAKIIDTYLESDMTMGEYCESNNISRYQFMKLLRTYESKHKRNSKVFKNEDIYHYVKKHSRMIQGKRILEGKYGK